MLPPVVAQLLICRGIRDPKAAREFLEPKLSDLREPRPSARLLRRAAEFLHQAISDGRQITIYGDYDVDGMTGTTILSEMSPPPRSRRQLLTCPAESRKATA